MKLYIAGPMSGIAGLNYPAFDAAEHALLAAGYEVVNPASHPDCEDWAGYLRLSIIDVAQVDGIATLPDWECSRGAVLEVHVAHALGQVVLPVLRWLDAKKVT